MTMTRRRVLELGSLGLPAAAWTARTPATRRSATPAESAQADRGILIVAEGLGVVVLAGSEKNPHAAAIALTNPEGIQMHGHARPLERHYATLAVPRKNIVSASSAKPTLGTSKEVFYALSGMDVSLALRTTADPESQTPSGLRFRASTRDAVNDPCQMSSAADWNSVDWLLKISRDLYPNARLSPNWRKSKFIDSLISLDFGSLEDPQLRASDPGADIDPRRWRVGQNGPTRTFKEALRHLIPQNGFLHITLTPRHGGATGGSVIVDARVGRVLLSITQLPKPGMPTDMLDDIVSYLGLLDDDGSIVKACLDGKCLPTYAGSPSCGGDTFGCLCCPYATIVDPQWQKKA